MNIDAKSTSKETCIEQTIDSVRSIEYWTDQATRISFKRYLSTMLLSTVQKIPNIVAKLRDYTYIAQQDTSIAINT